MNNDEQTGDYENIFLNFYFRRRRQQRLGNKQLIKKRRFRIRNIFLWRDDFGIFNTLQNIYLKSPKTPEQCKNISSKLEELWNFPHVLKATDGKHI